MQNLTQFAAALFNPEAVFDPAVIDAEAVAQADAPMLGLAAELADVVCNAGMAEAERVARMVQCVRGSDLKAILKAAIAHPDYVVDGPGLQGMAKHARGFGKPPKAAQSGQDDEVIEIQAIPDLQAMVVALMDAAQDQGNAGFANALMVVAQRHGIL